MAKRIPVLIVGSGPTGLMLACQLAHYHIDFRIIDRNPQPVTQTNASWIQTRTIEILDEVGLLDRFLNEAHKCNAIDIYSYGEFLTTISLETINSNFKFVLQLSQHKTEEIFNSYLCELNYVVERGKELIGFNQIENGINALIGHSDGEIENIECDWLIACDGANSFIRQKSNLPFIGTDTPQEFVVSDVEMDTSFSPSVMSIFFDEGTVLAVFPMGGYQYRINANLYTIDERYNINESEIHKIVKQRTYNKAIVNEVKHISPYYIHHNLINNMGHGKIFFAGDAAHVLSPAGGQGMNLGIQDAYNLAWKLAYVIKGRASYALLDSYQSERYPIAKRVIDRTKLVTTASLIENFLLSDMRNLGIKLLNKQLLTIDSLSDRLTQLDFEYQKSPIIDYDEIMNPHSPYQGQHAPNVIISPSKYLYDYLQNEYFNVLIFAEYIVDSNEFQKIRNILQFLATYLNCIKTHVISSSKPKGLDADNFIFTESEEIYKKYAISEPNIYIIRPDYYIAYCSKKLNQQRIEAFLEKILNLENIESKINE